MRTPIAVLLVFLWIPSAAAQDSLLSRTKLSRDHFKNGAETLRAFEAVSAPLRNSVVKLDIDGSTVALAAVIDANGLVVTKGSEIRPGHLTAWLANGKEVGAELIGQNTENDLALVKVDAQGLKPIRWATADTFVGQWVVTPGVTELPQAIGIISVPTRKIPPPRALIGVLLDHRSTSAQVETILPGLGAEKAGLKPGDLVLAVNGTPTSGREALIDRLREFREGQSVLLRVKRDDQQLEMSVELKVPKPERTGRDLDRSDMMDRMGTKLSQRAADFELAIQHDTVLQDWQCGGPLANLEGKAIGLNIARAGRVASYALPASVVVRAIQHLQSAPSTNEEESEKIKTAQPLQPAAQ